MPYAQMVAEQVSVLWVMEACHASVAKGVRQVGVIHPADGVETGSGASVVLPSTELNVIPLEGKQPLPSPIEPSVDSVGCHNCF